MRVLIFSKHDTREFRQSLEANSIDVVKTKPDIVCCYGGDGTFLLAEERYPGVPKLLLRKDSVCAKCYDLPFNAIAKKLKKRLRTTAHIKLQATIHKGKKKTLLPPAVNNIIIRNANPLRALRFALRIDGNIIDSEIIGDGVIIATPFGSTGYYHSITRESFDRGIGVALNNSVNRYPGLLCNDDVDIEIEICREAAYIGGDTTSFLARPGDKIIISRAKESARIVQLS